ncbi:hypothetical protein C5M78_02590 [Campylobacter jejuni]|nr:hypothetical protein [Campylobacter jejuni]EAJ3888576.1 hypothetical protein [Campylobacter jejuni]EAJ4909787.1 hypothetical protein [Campylobacter jejuni]EAJ8048582.1 hypothetical protein [Campylobacter jejuni]EAL1772380.1 hypothetical protein [Campylobacter jejuni]
MIAFVMLFVFDSKTSIIISAFIMGFPWGGVFGIALLFIAQKSSNSKAFCFSSRFWIFNRSTRAVDYRLFT